MLVYLKTDAKVCIYISVFVVVLCCNTALANTANSGNGAVIKSYMSVKASVNPLAMTKKQLISPTDVKDSFTFEDMSVTWSAITGAGYMDNDIENYSVYWYGPDGTVFSKETPKTLSFNCRAIKATLKLDRNRMSEKVGLWKVEAVYKRLIIDVQLRGHPTRRLLKN